MAGKRKTENGKRRGGPAFLALMGLLALAACAKAPASSTRPAEPAGPRVILPSGAVYAVELATNPGTRAQGLMFRESLGERRGMLFFFPHPAVLSFWMKNCNFSLDILWLDKDRRVLYVGERLPPCKADPCPNYGPKDEALYVLEINAGRAKSEALVPGAQVRFESMPDDLKVE